MPLDHLSDREIAHELARRIRSLRLDPRTGMTQADLARKSGVGLTPLKRFEKTGGTTLNNLIGIMRAMGLLSRLEALVPEAQSPSPMALLQAARKAPAPRQRARRKPTVKRDG